MQKVISKYGLAAHLALLAVAPLFLSPGTILWLAVPTAIWLLMEPSRVGSESLMAARMRVARSLRADPLFWAMVAVVVFAGVRFANGAVGMFYNVGLERWQLKTGVFSILPSSAVGRGSMEFAASAVLLVVVMGCRHALGKAARAAFVSLSTLIAGLVAIALVIQVALGLEPALALSEVRIANPSFIGATFGVYFIGGVAAIAAMLERGWLRLLLPVAIALAGLLAGLFIFAPPAVAVAYAGVSAVVFLFAIVRAYCMAGPLAGLQMTILPILSVAAAAMMVVAALPNGVLMDRLDVYLSGAFVPENFMAGKRALSAIAARIWKTHPWLGSGLGMFVHNLKFYAAPADWAVFSPLQTAPFNGYWMLLAERGAIGALVMACPLAMLLVTYVLRAIRGRAGGLPEATCWVGVLALLVAAVEAWADVSFLSPGMTVALASWLAVSANSFPKESHHG